MEEILSIYTELPSEEGERCRVRYCLWEERDGEERVYGIRSCVEGSYQRPYQKYCSPGIFGCRQVAQAALEYLAEHGVMPAHTEEILQEVILCT